MGDWDFDDVTYRFAVIADGLGEIPIGRTPGGSNRLAFAIALLSLAIEHFDSIAILAQKGRCGSAASLVRPLIDAGTRGCWLALAATDDQAERFSKNDKDTSRDEMLIGLSKIDGLEHGAFSVDRYLWKELHGLTHGGFNQASHRIRDGKV